MFDKYIIIIFVFLVFSYVAVYVAFKTVNSKNEKDEKEEDIYTSVTTSDQSLDEVIRLLNANKLIVFDRKFSVVRKIDHDEMMDNINVEYIITLMGRRMNDLGYSNFDVFDMITSKNDEIRALLLNLPSEITIKNPFMTENRVYSVKYHPYAADSLLIVSFEDTSFQYQENQRLAKQLKNTVMALNVMVHQNHYIELNNSLKKDFFINACAEYLDEDELRIKKFFMDYFGNIKKIFKMLQFDESLIKLSELETMIYNKLESSDIFTFRKYLSNIDLSSIMKKDYEMISNMIDRDILSSNEIIISKNIINGMFESTSKTINSFPEAIDIISYINQQIIYIYNSQFKKDIKILENFISQISRQQSKKINHVKIKTINIKNTDYVNSIFLSLYELLRFTVTECFSSTSDRLLREQNEDGKIIINITENTEKGELTFFYTDDSKGVDKNLVADSIEKIAKDTPSAIKGKLKADLSKTYLYDGLSGLNYYFRNQGGYVDFETAEGNGITIYAVHPIK